MPFVLVVGAVHESVADPVVAGVTLTVVLSVAEPPAPLQLSV